ncbi:hypothetical protein [Heliophilum fasciatum]|uniref:Glutamate synthase (NADPH) GltB3 subunit n=1 Tax=Heliophilum fasciatum TaxID=35700 RepID=A0A4R2RUZ6_9FIRM|nr:hypothetical protein [Heliophilum fasciatum]MCW2277163.1 glutamate synthase domain-containing protein 3 [Heliophilum fasciatum]TCP68202.1 glutamate synthase (NADPH) GltB3 subunit [Heliophilum fasciatum]
MTISNASAVAINAQGLYYKELNEKIRAALAAGAATVRVHSVNGQRYIGTGLSGNASLIVEGTAGNDLGAYMNGLTVTVYGNGQDGIANTMNAGTIVIHGSTGDTLGYAMRDGEVYVEGSVGFRVGIHMKEYQEKVPVLVIGGKAGSFFGEYMAGGILILLGLSGREGHPIVGDFCGTGMHGGVMYIRGNVEEHQLGKEVKVVELDEQDREVLGKYVGRYVGHFGGDAGEILDAPFVKLIPFNKRPYGNLYVGV